MFHAAPFNAPTGFSLSLIELLVANTTINERMTPWRKQVEAVTGDERTQWLENGLHLQASRTRRRRI